MRVDGFGFDVQDQLESLGNPDGATSGRVGEDLVSPKVSLIWRPDPSLDLFLNGGRGFHSNDARSATADPGATHLASARGSELGARVRVADRLSASAAAWWLSSDEELLWVGDGGEPKFSGETERWGLDLEARLAARQWLSLDADLNLADGRAVGEPQGADHIPLAPRITSTGGLTANYPTGVFGTLRYRLIGDRPGKKQTRHLASHLRAIFDRCLNMARRSHRT